MRQYNKEQQKTLNIVDNFPEQLWCGNVQQQSYTASSNTFKINKAGVELTSEDNNKDYFYFKSGVSISKPLEALLKSKAVNFCYL